jgi:hypothetical protein
LRPAGQAELPLIGCRSSPAGQADRRSSAQPGADTGFSCLYRGNSPSRLTFRPQSTPSPAPCCIFSATRPRLVFFFQKTVAIGENPD